MDNAPQMTLFLYALVLIFAMAAVLLIFAVVLMRKKRKKYKFWGRLCLLVSIISFVPVLLVAGYCLYLIV